jgi:transcriptional regulator with XRE-family HTH domain
LAKKSLNEKLLILSRVKGLTQSEVAKGVDMQPSHINRYFNGVSDLTSAHFTNILKVLGIDLEKIVSDEIQKLTGNETHKVTDLNSSIEFLFSSLDEIGRQTMLKHLHWVAQKTSKKKIPDQVTFIIQKEISRI